jgi:hypothetical protein
LALMIGTVQALMLALLACLLQVCRARYEDRLLARTFDDYGVYMLTVNSFIPRVSIRTRRRISLLCFVAGVVFLGNHATTSTRAASRIDPEIGMKCRAWHQKALSGQWFTKKEGNEFAETEEAQERLRSVPGCNDFFVLQRKCEDLYWGPDTTDNAAEAKRRSVALLNAIDSVPGCKSIIGFERVCDVIRGGAKGGPRLSPGLQSVLRECADESIARRTSDMIRPAQ